MPFVDCSICWGVYPFPGWVETFTIGDVEMAPTCPNHWSVMVESVGWSWLTILSRDTFVMENLKNDKRRTPGQSMWAQKWNFGTLKLQSRSWNSQPALGVLLTWGPKWTGYCWTSIHLNSWTIINVSWRPRVDDLEHISWSSSVPRAVAFHKLRPRYCGDVRAEGQTAKFLQSCWMAEAQELRNWSNMGYASFFFRNWSINTCKKDKLRQRSPKNIEQLGSEWKWCPMSHTDVTSPSHSSLSCSHFSSPREAPESRDQNHPGNTMMVWPAAPWFKFWKALSRSRLDRKSVV